MKRSKIIYGVIAFVLAIASAFTTRAKSSTIIKTFFTIYGGIPITVFTYACGTYGDSYCLYTTIGSRHILYGITQGGNIMTLRGLHP